MSQQDATLAPNTLAARSPEFPKWQV